MKETLWIEGSDITYELVRKNVKNISIRIKPDRSIQVTARQGVSKEHIEELILEKYSWIQKHLEQMEQQKQITSGEIQGVEGEKVMLLGYPLTLKILLGEENSIQMDEQSIYIHARNPEDKKMVQQMWMKWHEEFIRLTLSERVEAFYPVFQRLGIQKPKLRLRYMKTRWGTCNARTGIITLNKYLIQVPFPCIEYVVVHEYTHFLHMNHGKDFYRTLKVIMPDYKEREKLLKNYRIVQGLS